MANHPSPRHQQEQRRSGEQLNYPTGGQVTDGGPSLNQHPAPYGRLPPQAPYRAGAGPSTAWINPPTTTTPQPFS